MTNPRTWLLACAAAAAASCSPTSATTAADAGTAPRADARPGEPPDPPPPPPSGEVEVTEIPALPGSRLFVRPNAIPAPGIVMLHGSEGGSARYIDEDAMPLAEAGFAVVTFCWFDCPGKPDAIHRIPLEDTVAAIDWLRASDAVRGRPVGVYGVSRGAEQAVLLASLLPDTGAIATVAVHAPSDTVVASYDPDADDSIYEQDPDTGQWIFGPAWTWQGAPLYGETTSFYVPGPRIRVEDYPGALYLSHGVDDMLWPVQRSYNIQSARDAAGRVTEPHYWEGEGHIVMQPANVAAFTDTLGAFFARELGL